MTLKPNLVHSHVHDSCFLMLWLDFALCTHQGLGWQVMSFSWLCYMTYSSSDDHTLTIATKISVEHGFNFLIVESATPYLNDMKWPQLCPLCWVHHLAHHYRLIWHLIWHNMQGLDHSKPRGLQKRQWPIGTSIFWSIASHPGHHLF
jgi:hypothetical protein